ncbi:hypothetical protein MGYG_03265 [Nannizzia gypsea CBS 118893]|uniref:Uncharacterized protein n=1 Tax=Arthroderma gypseum (strain ATCC MYA-4604 / CBS 118893) TaxID=535722 RepID=E4UMQ8_ARTGP|nr:hypothetical protein MGYG_03265 [Nannizzia gypsea CBS 118893]EFR00262.1 hypothetical protein MGYG_03265 [Nannizzia gypsea CBS 118893]
MPTQSLAFPVNTRMQSKMISFGGNPKEHHQLHTYEKNSPCGGREFKTGPSWGQGHTYLAPTLCASFFFTRRGRASGRNPAVGRPLYVLQHITEHEAIAKRSPLENSALQG